MLVQHPNEEGVKLIADARNIIRLDNGLSREQQEQLVGRLITIGGSP